MPARRPELRLGRIIWALVLDRNQVPKRRPAIIITETALIRPDETFEVVPVTTSFSDPPPDDCIELPWHPTGNVMTRLRKRSAAVISWLDEIHPQNVLGLEGDVPPKLMIDIMNRVVR